MMETQEKIISAASREFREAVAFAHEWHEKSLEDAADYFQANIRQLARERDDGIDAFDALDGKTASPKRQAYFERSKRYFRQLRALATRQADERLSHDLAAANAALSAAWGDFEI
jgi:hypothetical protein